MSHVSTTDVSSVEPAARVNRSADSPPNLGFSATGFRNRLHSWYSEHARDLPWRGVHDPYATWLSEIMLQQTRVVTVQDRYFDFLERFPTLPSLAEAEESEVLALWSGLGYYRRARLLHRGAQFVMRELQGKLPRTAAELRTLPGIGDYTAAAVASIAFGQSVAVLDGNVERVLLRVLGRSAARSAASRAELAAVAQALMPPAARRSPTGRRSNPPGDHNQAMMELGATVCLPKAPLCLQCPLADLCKTRGEHPTPRRAPQQSRIVAHLVALRKRGVATEVLLERRSQTASQMPGMLELPSLALEKVASREPVLRLRHAITNTNYYVQIFAESAPGVEPALTDEHEPYDMHPADPPEFRRTSTAATLETSKKSEKFGKSEKSEKFGKSETSETSENRSPRFESPDWNELGALDLDDEAVFVANPAEIAAVRNSCDSLLESLSAAPADLEWISTTLLAHCPLTGLARKSLQRLGVMPISPVRIGSRT